MSKEEETIKYKYSVETNKHILFLIYLSHVYRLNLEMLLLLYDKLGEDIFYMFFMFAGKSLIMPKHTKMIKIRNFVDRVMDCLTSNTEDMSYSTQQEKSFLTFIKSVYDRESNTVTIGFEIPVYHQDEVSKFCGIGYESEEKN